MLGSSEAQKNHVGERGLLCSAVLALLRSAFCKTRQLRSEEHNQGCTHIKLVLPSILPPRERRHHPHPQGKAGEPKQVPGQLSARPGVHKALGIAIGSQVSSSSRPERRAARGCVTQQRPGSAASPAIACLPRTCRGGWKPGGGAAWWQGTPSTHLRAPGRRLAASPGPGSLLERLEGRRPPGTCTQEAPTSAWCRLCRSAHWGPPLLPITLPPHCPLHPCRPEARARQLPTPSQRWRS